MGARLHGVSQIAEGQSLTLRHGPARIAEIMKGQT